MIKTLSNTKVQGSWRRKLTTALVAGVVAWLPLRAANAAILDTVVATGKFGTTTISSSATATVDVEDAAPAMKLVKTGTLQEGGNGSADPGDSITYTFTITNTGNVTLKNISIIDPSAILTGTPIPTLAPGASDTLTYSATHVITIADIISGLFTNTAVARAHAASGQDISAGALSKTPINLAASMSLTKSGVLDLGSNGRADQGDLVTYSFEVKNTGLTPLHNVTVSDPLIIANLPGQKQVVALLDASQQPSDPITTASIGADEPGTLFAPVATAFAARLQTGQDVPQIATNLNVTRHLVRMSGTGDTLAEGDKIGFVYSLYNTGDVPLTGINVDQPGAVAYGDKLDILAVNEQDSASVIFVRDVTDQEIAEGEVIAPAIVSANARGHVIAQNLNASLPTSSFRTYDSFASASIAPVSFPLLNPGASTTFTATYALTQTDVDAGEVNNSATAKALNLIDQTLTSIATHNLSVPEAPAIALVKSGFIDLGADGVASIGDVVTYDFAVTNTGNVTLSNVTIADPQAFVIGAAIPTLAPNAVNTTNFTATRLLTQSDLDTGLVINQATASGTSPGKVVVTDLSDPDSLTGNTPTITRLAPNPAIALIKTVTSVNDINKDGRTNDGDTITYGFTVKNIGNQSLKDVIVTDPKITVLGAAIPVMAPATVDTGHFTGTYTITVADMDVGHIDNTAKVEGTASGNVKVVDFSDPGVFTEDAPTTTTLAQLPKISLVKTQSSITDTNANSVTDVGDVINYAFTVKNSGNVTLKTVTLLENLAGAQLQGAPLTDLAPGAVDTTNFTASYTITAADLTAGRVSNQATAAGEAPSGAVVIDLSDNVDFAQDNPTITPILVQPAIAVLKTVTGITDAKVNGVANGVTDAGDTIQYAFTVTNIGNTALTNVFVTDPKATVAGTHIASLPAGSTDNTTFTATHVLTQADLDAGKFENQAQATGTSPANKPVTDLSDPASLIDNTPTTVLLTPNPAIALLKTVTVVTDVNKNNLTDASDTITYGFLVKNTGNQNLTNVFVTDPKITVVGAPMVNMAPGAQDDTHFTGVYTITQADVDAGKVENTARVEGIAPGNVQVVDSSHPTALTQDGPTISPIAVQPSIALIKRQPTYVDANGNGKTDAGDILNYKFEIKNTSTVTMSNVSVTDPLAQVTGSPIPVLNAGSTDSTTFSASYVLTVADVVSGKFSNQATVHGTYRGSSYSDLSDKLSFSGNSPTVTTLRTGVALVKKALPFTDLNGDGLSDAGDVLNYALIVTNTGEGALTDITVTDPNGVVTISGSTPFSLAVGATDSTHFTATHVITAADILASGVTNQATVEATSSITNTRVSDLSDDLTVDGDDPTFTPLLQVPRLALIKTIKVIKDLNGSDLADVGDEINYVFEIHNTGNVDLTNITLTDANATLKPASFTLPLLAAGATDTISFTATHIVTPADARAGNVTNSATVSATAPSGQVVTDLSDGASLTGDNPTVTPVFTNVPILTKTASVSEVKRGGSVLYTITASNLIAVPFKLVDIMPPGFAYLAGSATVNGAAATPTVNARNLDFADIMPVSGKITLKLKLLASTTLGGGKFVNNAHLVDPATDAVLASARATVTITNEAVFDCSDIIGHVFDDKNANGYMDAGEPGLPGVRVVTLNGVLITTDSQGRYHVPCAAVPDSSIGSNYLLKLDLRTLPTGYKLTTENPRDVRVTRGKVVKLNFGASILREVRLDVTGKAFDADSTDLTTKWAKGIDQLLGVLSKNRSTLKIVYHRGGESEELAQTRADAIEETVTYAWKAGHGAYKLVTTTSVEDGK